MSKNWAFIVIALIIFGSCAPSISGYSNNADYFESVNVQDETTLKCYALGRYGVEETEITLFFEEAEHVYNKLKELQVEMNLNPFSEKVQKAKVEYVDLLAEKNLIHHSLTKNDYLSLLTPQWHNQLKKIPINDLSRNGGTASSFICSVTSGGTGIILPLILLPRPRMGLSWLGQGVYDAAVTGVGSLFLAKGFTALGEQTGIALGFMGVGLTYGSPIGPIYGFAGYALFVTVNAEYIETFPPNVPPEISDENPRTGSSNIPVSLAELSFRINDPNGDRMSYTVTTDPYIGSGSGSMKGNGVYTVPVSNLQSSTEYTWYVSVSDGQDTTEKTFSFTTVKERPIVSNPYPADHTSAQTSLSELRFDLYDAQGDLMDYTVESSLDIGSKNGFGVSNGTVTVPVSGLSDETWYYWYVNVTDGEYWTREVFSFYTGDFGLIGYWSFDEGSGSIAYDSSGNENHGNIDGASYSTESPSGFGYSLNFKRAYGDCVRFQIPIISTPPYTICTWVKPGTLPENKNLYILANGGETGNTYGFYMFIGGEQFPGNYWQFAGKKIDGMGSAVHTPMTSTNWNFLCGTWDGTTNANSLKFYINGELIVSGTPIQKGLENSPRNLIIGRNSEPGSSHGFEGLIDEIRIYDRVLSANEIQDLYKNPN